MVERADRAEDEGRMVNAPAKRTFPALHLALAAMFFVASGATLWHSDAGRPETARELEDDAAGGAGFPATRGTVCQNSS